MPSPGRWRCGGTASAETPPHPWWLHPSNSSPSCESIPSPPAGQGRVGAKRSTTTALPRHQLIALDALLGVQRDHGPHEEALLVRAAGVDGERAPELGDALSLVDV